MRDQNFSLNGLIRYGYNMLIFLNFDGVIVHSGCKTYKDIDPDCVAVLSNFCKKHNAKIVVSSVWRVGRKVKELDFTLFSYGLNKDTVIGKTDYGIWTRRDKEIKEWIRENKYEGNYVVIDDEIFDLTTIENDKIIHVIDGWNRRGLQQRHIDEWETK